MKTIVAEFQEDRPGEIHFSGMQIPFLSNTLLFAHCSEMVATEARGFYDIQPQEIRVGYVLFDRVYSIKSVARVELEQTETALRLHCSCGGSKKLLCAHQAQVLFNAMNREAIRVFFDAVLRKKKLLEFSISNGFTEADDPEMLFQPEFHDAQLRIVPVNKELLLLDPFTQESIRKQLLAPDPMVDTDLSERTQKIIVFRKHRFYDHLCIELCETGLTREGKLKKPIRPLNPYDFIWKTTEPDALRFYTALARFTNLYTEDHTPSDLEGLAALVKNPLGFPVYLQNDTSSDNPALSALVPVNLQTLQAAIHIHVDKRSSMYTLRGELELPDQILPLETLQHFFRYFIKSGNVFYFLADEQLHRLLTFFRQRKFNLMIPASAFDAFREDILNKLGNTVRISYAHLKPATEKQKQESGLDASPEKILYLNNTGNYIQLIPAMRYGPVEVPIMSRRQIYTYDSRGNAISILRDEVSETDFLATLFKLMPALEDEIQTGNLYIHKALFLDEEWFPDVFETFRQKQITVLGFNALSKHPINTHKAKISVQVRSGMDWFETQMDVRFGSQKARLKQLSTAVRNKSKYVQLDDGTRGILPAHWIERFARYFSAGIVADELITTPKIRFQEIAQLYEAEFLDESAKAQLAQYHEKIDGLASLSPVEIPQGLHADLRDYQKQGLNWLSLLHQFGFGGCLADDMGLGKTIQIIAFILSLKEKGETGTHLIVVPTSLLFNWKDELTRFAPTLNIATVYGADRNKQPIDFSQYDVLITSYGVLQSDIKVFKAFGFHLLVLDESQSIKNPETQRYKAVCLLQARQRIVLTGTPLENNTFDLYGQLSFACPGLLGSKLYFKQVYSIPIDTFKESRRAKELQQKIKPFILRRTKKQVATELPDKTEMLLYCEMGIEQRRVYDAYAKELREFIANKQPDDILRNSMYVLRGLTRLRQICNAPALLNESDYFGEHSSKIEALLEQIELHAPNHKILVFSQFVGMLELIRKALIAREIQHEFLSGQTKDRQERVNHFRENDQVRVFLISLKAGGTGLNLTEADYVFLVDPWWNPAVENQAIDRSHRIGQTKTVTAIRLLCPDTIEDKIRILQESKRQLITDLIPSENSLLQAMSKADLLNLLSP